MQLPSYYQLYVCKLLSCRVYIYLSYFISMLHRITLEKLKGKEGFARLSVDVVMLLVVVVNLVFIIFDWHFGFDFFRKFLEHSFPRFFAFYRDHIHPDFLLYDLIFVTIFISELLLQWIIAIKNSTYVKWWLYPFIHWYDVLGCIPLGTFVWLRLFRVLAITIKLHKMGVIDLKHTFIYKQFYAVYQIFVEEVSDMALIQLIESIQREVKKESEGSIIVDAIKPGQDALAEILSSRLQQVAEKNYHAYRDDIKVQIQKTIRESFEQSEKIKKIEQLPMIGTQITETLESSLNDISFHLADKMASRLASDEIARLVQNAINTSFDAIIVEDELESTTDKQDQLSQVIKDIIDRALQQLKEDIKEGATTKNRRIPKPES